MSQAVDVGQDADQLHFSVARVMLLVCLPALTTGLTSFAFSAAASHYRDNGWDVWHLGMMFSAGYLIRPMLNSLIAFAGSWVAAALYAFAALMVLPAAVMPNVGVFVNIEIVIAQGVYSFLALQCLCYSEFAHCHKVISRASRVQTASAMIGEAVAPFISGALYDLGGWRACAFFHFVSNAGIAFMLATNPIVIEEWRRCFAAEEVAETQEMTEPPSPLGGAIRTAGSKRASQTSWLSSSLSNSSGRRRSILASAFPTPQPSVFWPGFAVSLAFGVNSSTYMALMSNCALYYREIHDWTSSAVVGLVLMVGGLIGAFALLALISQASDDESRLSLPTRWSVVLESRCGNCLLQGALKKPYPLAWLLFADVLSCVGFLSPSLFLAVLSVIVVGIVFVFFMQWVNEMNVLYSFGDQDAYVRLQAFSYAFYSIGFAVSGWGSSYLYDTLGPRSPFYVCAGLCTFTLCLYIVCFWMRVGFGQSLRRVEYTRQLALACGTRERDSSILRSLSADSSPWKVVSNPTMVHLGSIDRSSIPSIGKACTDRSFGVAATLQSAGATASARKARGRDSLFWRASKRASLHSQPDAGLADRAQHESKAVDKQGDCSPGTTATACTKSFSLTVRTEDI